MEVSDQSSVGGAPKHSLEPGFLALQLNEIENIFERTIKKYHIRVIETVV